VKRTAMPRGRKALAPVSARRAAEATARAEVRETALSRAGYTCEARLLVPDLICRGPLDVDEICPRSAAPGGHLDLANVQVLCRAHHDWKHANPERAHDLGLRKWSWEYDQPVTPRQPDPLHEPENPDEHHLPR
jgi:hypothetical protein